MELVPYMLVGVAGILVFILFLIWWLHGSSQEFRNRIDIPATGRWLGSFFGVNRKEDCNPDVRAMSRAVMLLLEPIGGSHSYFLRNLAERAAITGTLPKVAEPGSEEYQKICEAIEDVCQQLAGDERLVAH